MEAHKSFRTTERLAPLAIISSVRFSAASRDSARDGPVIFSRSFDLAGGATLTASLSCISEYGSRRDSWELFISIGPHRPILAGGNPGCKNRRLREGCGIPLALGLQMRPRGRIFLQNCFSNVRPLGLNEHQKAREL